MSVTTQNPCLDMPPPILLSLDSNLPKSSINDTAAYFTSGSHPILIRYVIDSLGSQFSLKYLAYLEYFLDIEVKKVQDGLILSQSKYILSILSEFSMKNCKFVLTPMCSGKLPRATDGSPPAKAYILQAHPW
uniref:Reverse transcriptase Ty1/copia-type domain-containing protein n=1 Tax=Solanum lycopersicum TaxID=4081 RepID=A0A3Q7H9Z2_SOLLC